MLLLHQGLQYMVEVEHGLVVFLKRALAAQELQSDIDLMRSVVYDTLNVQVWRSSGSILT